MLHMTRRDLLVVYHHNMMKQSPFIIKHYILFASLTLIVFLYMISISVYLGGDTNLCRWAVFHKSWF